MWKITILRQKNYIFTNFRGGARRVRPPLNPPLHVLILVWILVLILLHNGVRFVFASSYLWECACLVCVVFCVCLRIVMSKTLCRVFVLFVFVLCLVCLVLSVSLDCPFFGWLLGVLWCLFAITLTFVKILFSVITNKFRTRYITLEMWLAIKYVWRYKRRNLKPWIYEEQTIQWPQEKWQKDKQRSTKQCTENSRLRNTNPTKNWRWIQVPRNGKQFLLHYKCGVY
jgi:hypothetical protein